jgi:putative ABC transport system permease protein
MSAVFVVTQLIRRHSWPYLGEHKLRTGLTVLGVALGVATVVAISDASESVLASFQHMVRTVAGDSELEVSAASGHVAEDVIADAAGVSGVAAAAGVVETFLPLADAPQESVLLLGIDFLGSPVWQTQFPRSAIEIDDELAFVNRLDSAAVARRLAQRLGLEKEGELRVIGPRGAVTLRVRGFLGDTEATRLFDGALVVMDLPAAQRLLGRDGWVDRVALQLASGPPVEEVRRAVARAVGPEYDVAPPEGRGEQTEKLLFSFRLMLACLSLSSVVVGGFIVYHTAAVSVRQRRREFALLNALGFDRSLLVVLCVVEMAILGGIGVALGIAGGRVLGRVVAALVGYSASEIWVRVRVTEHVYATPGLILSVAVGLGVTLLTAYLAIRATFEAPTVEALRPAAVAGERPVRRWLRVAVAALLLAASWLIALAPPNLGLVATTSLVIASVVTSLSGAALLAPAVVSFAGQAAAALVRRAPWVAVRLAGENLPRTPSRGGATVATITAALGIAVTLVCLVESMQTAWLDWVREHFAADLLVGSGGRVRILAGPPMDLSVGAELERVPGVARVEPFRILSIRVAERPVFLQGLSIPDRLARGGLPMVHGDFAAAAPALAAGTGVLLSDNLADRLRLARGDEIVLPTPAGERRFRIEGTYTDYLGSLDMGAVAVAQNQLEALWHDRFANLFRVWLAPGAPASAVRAAILGRFPAAGGYYVLTSGEFLAAVRAALLTFFVAAWALEIVATLVSVIGVVNAQVATVLDRATEIATLRTIGLSSGHLTGSVLLECAALGALGGLCGIALGAMQGAQMMHITVWLATGWRIPLLIPALPLLLAVALAALVSAAAGYAPARAAARFGRGVRSVD